MPGHANNTINRMLEGPSKPCVLRNSALDVESSSTKP